MTDAPNYLDTIPPADQAVVRQALLDWKAAGMDNPLIPLDADVNGDGIADAFGLDAFGNLTIVSDVAVTHTVSESTGEGITEQGDTDG